MTWWGPRPSGGRGCRPWRRCSRAWTATGTGWSAGTSSSSTAATTTGDTWWGVWRTDPGSYGQFHFIILNYCYLPFKIGCLRRPIWADWKLRLEQNYWKYFALLAGGEEQILNLIIASIQIAKLTLARAWIKVCRRAGASKFKYFMFSVFTTASPSCPRGHSGPNKDNVRNLMTQTRDSSISTYIYPSIITLNEYSLSSSRSHVLDNLNRYSAFCVFIQIIPKDSF